MGEGWKDNRRIKCTNIAICINRVGMSTKKLVLRESCDRERRILERLREHPELMARFESILELAGSEEGPLKTADEVEDLLIREVRLLGQATMNDWAAGAEARVAEELKSGDRTIRSRKKKH